MDKDRTHDELILDSLPHWAMLIDSRTRTILAANKLAKSFGSKILGQCWDDFGHRQYIEPEHLEEIKINPDRKRDNCIKCNFCEGDESLQDNKTRVIEKELDGIRLKQEKLEIVIKTFGAVTHEMSQPLMVVLGYLEMIFFDLTDGADTDSKDMIGRIEHIIKSCIRMKDILNKIQNITEIKTKKYLNGEILDILSD